MELGNSMKLTPEEDQFFENLPSSGKAVGNTYVRNQLGIGELDYWRIRDSLVSRRLVGVGRGRGGSVFRVVSPQEASDNLGGSETDELFGTEADSVVGRSRLTVHSVAVTNFKRIGSAEVDLSPVTVLVGGNNSGKSSFLQAIHTAVSCAQESKLQGRTVIAEANLRYSPTHDFERLGHRQPYENRADGHRGSVVFQGLTDRGVSAEYKIEMYKGANQKNVGVERSGHTPGFGSVISDPKNLFSVYVPGLSGILLQEESHGYASIFMRAARGDANLVFRNILERLVRDNKQAQLEGYLEQIFGFPVSLSLRSDPEHDMFVDIRLAKGAASDQADFLPVELWGMGVLQVTQLLAYALLFEPEVLLVDEPDSHVHPSGQKLLMLTLEQLAIDLGCRIVISTHSRHLVESAPEDAKIIWMKDGEVVPQTSRSLIPILMDLGAIDSFDPTADYLMATEDEKTEMLDIALQALPGMRVRSWSFYGLRNAQRVQRLKEMLEVAPDGPRVVVHRDRDFLTEDERQRWSEGFRAEGIQVFYPRYSDIEHYFTTSKHIAKATGLTEEEALELRNEVIADKQESFAQKFEAKRADANGELWPTGGSPANDSLWDGRGRLPEEFLYGKSLLNFLNVKLRSEPRVKRSSIPLEKTACDELVSDLSKFFGKVVTREGN